MIEWRDVTFAYRGFAGGAAGGPSTLASVNLVLDESELALVAGRTGSGKSTLLGTINGLVPQFTGGHLRGDVLIDGASILGRPPRELADLVGYVGQDPLAGFVTDTVEEELAYGMEQLGYAPQTMRRRVEETLDLLGIADLRRRPLRQLSGGQQQRVAIGAVLTTHPRVLVLDEPTSALDPTAAEEVLGILARLVDDVGLTVVLAEHRMERVVPFADRLVLVEPAGVRSGTPAQMLADSPVAPPLIELGRLAGWAPLPLSVRAARRLRGSLELDRPPAPPEVTGEPVVICDRLVVKHGSTVAVRHASLTLRAGEITALMGRNGSGKSTLLWAIQGAGSRDSGRVMVSRPSPSKVAEGVDLAAVSDDADRRKGPRGWRTAVASGGRAAVATGVVTGVDPAGLSAEEARRLVGLVPQTAADLLYLETVDQECAVADEQAGLVPGSCRTILDRLAPGVPGASHPRDLSEGQRLSLALAVVLTSAPGVVLLDEPTRGLDYAGKAQLASIVRHLADEGRAVLVATHDVEFVAHVADSVVVLAGGEVVSAGAAAAVIAESPAFAPQVSKVLGPGWLTVEQVEKALL